MNIDRRTFVASMITSIAGFRTGQIWAHHTAQESAGTTFLAECETVFLGASAYSMGAAIKNPANTVVLEQSLMLVPEFSGALLPNVLKKPESEVAVLVHGIIEKENLCKDGRYHAPPVSDVISSLVMRHKVNLMLNVTLANIQESDGKFVLDVIGVDGHSRIRAERVIDTTPLAWRDAGAKHVKAKFLAAPLVGGNTGKTDSTSTDKWEIVAGPMPGEIILKVFLPANTDWSSARLELYDIFENSVAKECHCNIGGEATALGHIYNGPPINTSFVGGVAWHPGAQHDDLMSALSAGELCVK